MDRMQMLALLGEVARAQYVYASEVLTEAKGNVEELVSRQVSRRRIEHAQSEQKRAELVVEFLHAQMVGIDRLASRS